MKLRVTSYASFLTSSHRRKARTLFHQARFYFKYCMRKLNERIFFFNQNSTAGHLGTSQYFRHYVIIINISFLIEAVPGRCFTTNNGVIHCMSYIKSQTNSGNMLDCIVSADNEWNWSKKQTGSSQFHHRKLSSFRFP